MKGPKVKIFVGDIIMSNSYGPCEVVEYNGIYDIKVKFTDGTVVKTYATCILKGQIKNPNHPKVYGRGFIGQGNFTSGKTGNITKEYNTWMAMMTRCYDLKNQQPSYIGCEVTPAWYNFQVFAEWATNQPGFGLQGWCLDKDLLGEGTKTYGPDSCCFIPQSLNNIFREKKRNGKSNLNLARGVVERHGKFSANSSFDKKSISLGTYLTEEDAFMAVKEFVKGKVIHLANLNKDNLLPAAYEKMLSFNYMPH